jgi:DNA-binding response OmpR family regulator
MRVLFVDDDLELLDLMENYSMVCGFDYRTAVSAEKALGIAERERFDIIFIDIALPGMNGFQAAQELLALQPEVPPKIIIMSSRDVQQERGRARIAGASAVIQKPFTKDDLCQAISVAMGI